MTLIDVCTYQGFPEWNKIKDSGIDFAMIKAGQGRAESSSSYLFQDSKFAYNITNANTCGVKCGTYYYFTGRTKQEAIREAKHFISIMEPYKKLISLYAAIDVESVHLKGISKNDLSALVKVFCDEVEKAGYKPMVYTNPDWLRTRLNGIDNRPLWLALWRSKNLVPSGYGDMKIWQWGTSKVNGIMVPVDTNFAYFSNSIPTISEPIIAVPIEKFKIGDKVRVENPINYDNGKTFKLYYPVYDLIDFKGKRAVVGIGKIVTAAVHIDYLSKV